MPGGGFPGIAFIHVERYIGIQHATLIGCSERVMVKDGLKIHAASKAIVLCYFTIGHLHAGWSARTSISVAAF